MKNNFWLILLITGFVLLGDIFLAHGETVSTEDAKDSIEKIENKIEKEEAQKAKLEGALNSIQSSINSTQREIEKTEDLINKTEKEIERKREEIRHSEKTLDFYRESLKMMLRQAYYESRKSVVGIAMSGQNINDSFQLVDDFVNLKFEIKNRVEEIIGFVDKIKKDKNELEDKVDDHEDLLRVKEMQQGELLGDKKEVQLDLMEKNQIIAKLNSQLNDLRSKYSAVLGKSVSTNDIIKAAEFAAKATGMSKAFLLGVLIQESNKGQFTGGCDYKQSNMSSARLEIFKDICSELGYNYKKQKVSCPPKSYKGTGGAMGVAQFMPDTWKGYKSQIASLTGNNPPNPWSLVDGVTAMAIKLSKDGAGTKKRFYEAKSYCTYLAGGNWGYYCFGTDKYKSSYEGYNCWGSSIKNYGEKVLCLKDNYEKFY